MDNSKAWNTENYKAWVKRFGEPREAADKIKNNPIKFLGYLKDEFESVENKKIANLMGSNGTKAVALACMGAEVTVVDFSYENKVYAEELSREAGVEIDYLVSDVLKIDNSRNDKFDIVFAEMGIIHYFTDLVEFFNVFKKLLKKGGRLILRDFHPVSTKLISSKGTTAKIRKHKVNGDYFYSGLYESEVAFTKYLENGEEEIQKVMLRRWTIGEVVTAIANAGLTIEKLVEEPNLSCDVFDKGIPKTFRVTAIK